MSGGPRFWSAGMCGQGGFYLQRGTRAERQAAARWPFTRNIPLKNEAKLGHSGRGLSFLDRKRFCFKIRSSALDVIVGNPKEALDRAEEKAAAQEARKEAPPSAAAQEADKKEINAFRRAVMERIERRRRIAGLLRAILI